MARIFSPSVQVPIPVSGSGVILGATTCPGNPFKMSESTVPRPRPDSTSGPPTRLKPRCEWQPPQFATLVNTYFPRAIRSGAIDTLIDEAGAMAGLRRNSQAMPAPPRTTTASNRLPRMSSIFFHIAPSILPYFSPQGETISGKLKHAPPHWLDSLRRRAYHECARSETRRVDMNPAFTRVWQVAAGVLVFLAAGAGVAQQGFPERPGDWEFTSKTDALPEPMVDHFCLTNETWAKALTQVPDFCKIQDLSVT